AYRPASGVVNDQAGAGDPSFLLDRADRTRQSNDILAAVIAGYPIADVYDACVLLIFSRHGWSFLIQRNALGCGCSRFVEFRFINRHVQFYLSKLTDRKWIAWVHRRCADR